MQALHAVATLGIEEVKLVLIFDALGDDAEPEASAQQDHSPDDQFGFAVSAEAGDEGTIDLQLVDRQRPQPAETGVTGAEIV